MSNQADPPTGNASTADVKHNVIGTTGRKVFRRKKRWQGSIWAPPSMSADVEDGLWCRQCKKRHGFMTMKVEFELQRPSGIWNVLWLCPVYFTVLGSTNTSTGQSKTNTSTASPNTNGEVGTSDK